MEKKGEEYTRRERQIMDIVYEKGEATVADVLEAIPDAPSYSAVRAMMNLLKDKGVLKHREDGRKYVYFPKKPRNQVRRTALMNLLQTFFGGSVEQAVASLLESNAKNLSDADLARLSEMIENARKEGR